jgi:hypothetical protein
MEIVILSAAGIIAATIAYFQYKIGIRASEKSRLPPELMSFMSEFSDRNNTKTSSDGGERFAMGSSRTEETGRSTRYLIGEKNGRQPVCAVCWRI